MQHLSENLKKVFAIILIILMINTLVIPNNLYANDDDDVRMWLYNKYSSIDYSTVATTGINEQAGSQIEQDKKDAAIWDPEAEEGLGLSSLLIVPTVGLFTTIADGVYKVFQNFIIGGPIFENLPGFGNHIVIGKNDGKSEGIILEESEINDDEKNRAIPIDWGEIYHLPTMFLTPGAIFEGKVAALNANFFDPDDESTELGGERMSTVSQLKSVVSSWYITLRNIAIVGLLSVLIYIGIRIVMSSSNSDKAKYKQFFMDWLVALCLIFFMHYIMSFMMTITDSITSMLASSDSTSTYQPKEILVEFGEDGVSNDTYMYTSFAGVARLRLQYDGTATKLGYMVLYVAFVGYTVYFSFVYLKRILYLAFFTMIAPLVALTYPIDKMKDGKAQAFNYWFKEYVFYSLLQPLHLLLYTVFVSSAISLASQNMIYAIVAMAFIVPAEKIVKSMFGIRGQTEGGIGGFAGGAVAASLFNSLRKMPKQSKKPAGGKEGSPDKVRYASMKNQNTPDSMDVLAEDAANIPGANNEAAGAMPVVNNVAANNAGSTNALTDSAQAFGDYANNADNYFNSGNTGAPHETYPIQTTAQSQARQIHRDTSAPQPRTAQNRQSKINNAKRYFGKKITRAGGAAGIAKKVGKAAIKGYVTAGTAIGMGAVGLGIGAVGGNIGDLGKGLAAGVSAGGFIGSNLGNRAGAGVEALGNIPNSEAYQAIWEGKSDEEIQRQQYVSYYQNNSEYRNRLIKKLEKDPEFYNQSESQREQIISTNLEKEAEMSFDTGITNHKVLREAVKMESKLPHNNEEDRERAHKLAVATAQLSEDYSPSIFADSRKLQNAKDRYVSQVIEASGNQVTEAQARSQAELIFKHMEKMKR